MNQHIKRAVLVGVLACAAWSAMAQQAQPRRTPEQLRQLALLDKMDHQDFVEHLQAANACTRARQFDCAEASLVKAAKVAGNAQDKKTLQEARQNLSDQRKAQQEEQAAAERERASVAAAQAAAAPAAVAPAADSMPVECVKLVAAYKACDQVGGFSGMGCRLLADSQYKCPIPATQLIR